ncbi:MAG TPA: protease modulator HflC [Phycisphaerae bacterium]|jgi:membrane protease subunit HflC|nr:protease modulator HflC [Phycisphaerae bacterium]
MSKQSLFNLFIALLVVGILVFFACTYQVNFSEVAVKVRLGKADENSIIREPGLKFRWPLIDSIETYDIRLRTLDTPETEIKTVDGKNLIVGSYAVWTIADPLKFYTRVRTVKEAENRMRPRLAQSQAAVIGQSTLADFVNLDQQQKEASYTRLLQQMLDGARAELLADYGIDVTQIGFQRISLPKEATQQVFESMRQERNKLAARYRQEGKSRAEGIKARAEASATQILAFADRRAKEIESAGIQASTRILAMIAPEDREFFEWLRWLDALKQSLAQKTTFFLDERSPLFEPFVRPPVAATSQPTDGRPGQ